MKPFNFVLIILVLFLSVVCAKLYLDSIQNRRENPSTTNFALKPDTFLENANRDLKRHYFKTSHRNIQKAIAAMRMIQKDFDEVSIAAIEVAIADLELLEEQLAKDMIDPKLMSEVFMYALNSLAYAQMRVSEELCEKGDRKAAKYALKYALEHLHNASRFSDNFELEIEREVYRTIDSLIKNDLIETEILRASVNPLLVEMDTTILKVSSY